MTVENPLSTAITIAKRLCKTFEGFSSTPYKCPAGYWTQGFGTVYKPDGSRVKPDDPPVTELEASQWLSSTLSADYLIGVLSSSPHLINHPQVLGALTDFAYNLGVPRYRASTLKRKIDSCDWEGAVIEIKKWRKAGGRVLPGLVRRREAESLFLV